MTTEESSQALCRNTYSTPIQQAHLRAPVLGCEDCRSRSATPRTFSCRRLLGQLLTGVKLINAVAEHQEELQKLWDLVSSHLHLLGS